MKQTVSLFLSVILLLGMLCSCQAHVHAYALTVIAPTCKTIGYTIHACDCGDTYYSDYKAESAHEFGTWQTGVQPTLTEGGEEYRICKTCGILEARDVGNQSKLAKLYATTEGAFLYTDGELRFSCIGTLTTRTAGDKRAYNLHLQNENDDSYAVDLGWGERASYALEPCVPDPTLTRASVAEKLWHACAETRSDKDWMPAEAYGSTPVQLYLDGSYLGVFALTAPADGWKYAYSGYHGSPTAVLQAKNDGDGCSFASRPSYENGDFEVLSCSTDEVLWATESFDGFNVFVRDAKDAAFREQLSQYSDPGVLIDYFLLTQFFGLSHGDTAETVWLTADGIHWLPSFAFDSLNTAFGINAFGALYSGSQGIAQAGENGSVLYTGDNLLWARLCNMFGAEIKARYKELRKTILNIEALESRFGTSFNHIEKGLFTAERLLYPSVPVHGMSTDRMRQFWEERLAAMDAWLKN